MNPLEKSKDDSGQSEAKSAHPVVRKPATPLYQIKTRPDMGFAPERPMEAARWLGAGFGLAFLVLLALGLIWIVASGVGTGRWVWQPAPATSSTPRPATPTPLSEADPTLSPEVSPSPTPSSTAGRGTIKGTVGFPSEFAPSQTICAELTTNASSRYCTDYTAGTGANFSYSINAPAGTYFVYAQLKAPVGSYSTTYRAYYNEFVSCGMEASCPDALHDKYIPVTVKVGAAVTGVDPTDWYALDQ